MKKLVKLVLATCIVFGLFACKGETQKELTDAQKFKQEYEALNGTIREKDGKTIRPITIDEDNPFVYKTSEEIIEFMKDGKSFVVYFGFTDCPWCRSVLETLVKVCKDEGLETVYYVNVKDIRDTLTVNENGEVVTDKKGSDGYYQLLDAFHDVLSDYSLRDKDGNAVDANEKRIYAPNIVSVVDGKAKTLSEGTSPLQTDGYMELTQEMIDDMYEMLQKVVKEVMDDNGSCSYTEPKC